MIQPTLTQNGIALMVKAFCGAEIQFTKLKIGSGSSRDIDVKTLTDLINPIKNINISRMDRNDNNIILVGAGYDNSEVENDITWNEVGVYATDPDEGEILFAYVNTEDALEIIKSNQSGVSIENNLSVMLLISSDINVTAVITSIQYASKQELLEHIKLRNPHGLTKADIKLENVENLAISDQKPVFNTGISLTNIKKGDTLKTIVSKIWTAIDALTKHLTAYNPHNINVSKIGAASSTHYHSASNITSGILSKERGGTGGNTGTIEAYYSDLISASANKTKTVGSITLDAGVWIITTRISRTNGSIANVALTVGIGDTFYNNASNATFWEYEEHYLSTNGVDNAKDTFIKSLTSKTTIYISVESSRSESYYCIINAVRII